MQALQGFPVQVSAPESSWNAEDLLDGFDLSLEVLDFPLD
jgi:hypothetical protein